MANNPQVQCAHPLYPQASATPFSVGNTAGAAAINTITLAAVAGRRYFITRVVCTSAQVAVVNGDLTITNILNNAGAAGTLTYKFVEGTTTGGQLILDFSSFPLVGVDLNTAVVVSLAAIGSGAATALEVSGFLI